MSSTSVSYTHLDVYKRQMLYLDSYLTICVILASMVPLLVSVFFSGALQRAECCTSKHHADFIALLKDLFLSLIHI